MKFRLSLLASAACALTLTSSVAAHVEITPEKVPADSFVHLSILVPTERKVPTVKLEIKVQGLDDISVQTKPGWQSAKRGSIVTWSGGKIGPGEFDEFGLSAHVPNAPGKTLIFPAIQTYSDGKIVRWIGTDVNEPPPHVTIEAVTATKRGNDHDGLTLGIAIAGLAAAVLALGVALFRKRRA